MPPRSSSAQILIAEDDKKQAELIRRSLAVEGFQTLVTHDGRSALDLARQRQPQLAILDIMMPNMDGLDVCRAIRYEMDIPIIFVTARSTEEDQLLGLDLGADDYLTKPYSPRVLVAKVRTVLRRSGIVATQQADAFTMGTIDVNLRSHKVTKNGETVDVTAKEFAVLAALAAERGKVFNRRQLMDAAFGNDYYGLDRTIDVHVANVRKKLEDDPTNPTFLKTVYGVGYRLAEEGEQ